VCNDEHRFMAQEQLREVGQMAAELLLEPLGRNTAPALTLAALATQGDPVMVVTPADQMIHDEGAYQTALRHAIALANEGSIVVLGITPTHPETGYGYICAKGDVVEAFVEKPNLATATRYVREGNYFWNSGMFVLKASVWLAALKQFRPDIEAATQAAWQARTQDAAFIRPDKSLFEAIPADSVDYAVMEKCPSVLDIRMVPLNAGWSDLGSWDAVWQAAEKDERGNAIAGDALIQDSNGVLVQASNRLVAVVGVNNVAVVETADAVLVIDRARSQEVKKVVDALPRRERGEHTHHRKVLRPWGWYDSVDEGDRFKVKRILVNVGASLSLQKHAHRAEHWVVVRGTAKVECDDKTLTLSENQSTYIPLGATHRLSNAGDVPLEIIEVQSGAYLGEDDIVRLEDNYGRNT
jgi:mannose-1-phosphate guanylyltransferase / mannose-6-phosphate isomerase